MSYIKMNNIWNEIGEDFDNNLARLTAVYVKESDSTNAFVYPTGENKLAYNLDKSIYSAYDQPPRLRFEFAAFEFPSICGVLGSNRALINKQTYFPSMIKREYEYMNLAIYGTERLARLNEDSLTWSIDMTSRTEGFNFGKTIYSLISSEEAFSVKKFADGVKITLADFAIYFASDMDFEFGLYKEELKMKAELKESKLSSTRSGHYLVIKQKFDLKPQESLTLNFALSEKSSKKAKAALSSADLEKIVMTRWNKWFESLPKVDISSSEELRAYYKSWLTIKNNYYTHPDWGHCVTESLPVYKGIWQWAIPSVEWHSEQNSDYTSEWIKKAMDMLLFNQRDDGYVTHAIYIDEKTPGEHWGGTSTIQTPHLPWVAVRYYNATGDIESIKKWMKPLVKYYEYLNESRDKVYKKLHLWAITSSFDTGLDTTSVFQRVTYGDETGKENYCYPAIMAAERARYEYALAELLNIIGEDGSAYIKEAEATVQAMNKHLWDEERGWYGVIHEDDTLDTRVGVDGLFTLVYGLVDETRVYRMKENFKSLIGEYGVRTVAEGEKGFREDVYWRGACWPKTCSLGMYISTKYYPEYKEDVFKSILNFVLKYPNVWECINVRTGELARSDHGFVCSPGMSSNVGAGDIIGSIWLYHEIMMYDMDMAIPTIKIKDFHHKGLRISITPKKQGYVVTCKPCEKNSEVVKFIVDGKIKEVKLKAGKTITL